MGVQVERSGSAAIVTLDWPEQRNAIGPEEAIELTEALTAFTAGSAYASHLDEAGTIAVGRLADLAVLDRDLFDRGAGEIADARVVATFVGGDAVHETRALEG